MYVHTVREKIASSILTLRFLESTCLGGKAVLEIERSDTVWIIDGKSPHRQMWSASYQPFLIWKNIHWKMVWKIRQMSQHPSRMQCKFEILLSMLTNFNFGKMCLSIENFKCHFAMHKNSYLTYRKRGSWVQSWSMSNNFTTKILVSGLAVFNGLVNSNALPTWLHCVKSTFYPWLEFVANNETTKWNGSSVWRTTRAVSFATTMSITQCEDEFFADFMQTKINKNSQFVLVWISLRPLEDMCLGFVAVDIGYRSVGRWIGYNNMWWK